MISWQITVEFIVDIRMKYVFFCPGTLQPLYRITKRGRNSVYDKLAKQTNRRLSLTQSTEPGLQAHLEKLIDVITETAYRHVTYGLFAQHRIVFSFLLCCNIMKKSIDPDTERPLIEKPDWSSFIWGASAPAIAERKITSSDEDKNLGIVCCTPR